MLKQIAQTHLHISVWPATAPRVHFHLHQRGGARGVDGGCEDIEFLPLIKYPRAVWMVSMVYMVYPFAE